MVSMTEIEQAIRRWELKAKSEMRIDGYLDDVARRWLIEELMSVQAQPKKKAKADG